MMKKIPCPKCDGWGHISIVSENSVSGYTCEECDGSGQVEVTMTNADRIRAMTGEELAEQFAQAFYKGYSTACQVVLYDGWRSKVKAEILAILQKPAEGD